MPARYILMFFTLSGAGACLYFACEEYALSSRSSREPEEIAVRDLIARGTAGNPNVSLKDFAVVDDFVVQKKLLTGRWTKVWVPVTPDKPDPAGAEQPPAIRLFLFVPEVANERALRQLVDQPRLRGMVNPTAPRPGILGSVLIQRAYPGTDSSRCLIVELGKEPAGMLKFVALGVGGVLLVFMTGGILYLARLGDRLPEPTTVAGPPRVLPPDGTELPPPLPGA